MKRITKIIFNLIFILLFSIVLLEILLKFYYKSKPFGDNRNRHTFALIEHDVGKGIILPILEVNTLMQTNPMSAQAKIFKFKPNNNIRWDNYYYNKDIFIKEWSYSFHTNNFGLVQKNDILNNKKSILFLGDSFTQGVGAEPWIDKFQGKISDLQVVNAGLIGTGFQQFKMMEQHLSLDIDIRKIVFLYIGSDIRRNLIFTNSNNFGYEFPLSNKEPYDFLKKIQKDRSVEYKKLNIHYKIKYFIKNQHLGIFAKYIVRSLRSKNNKVVEYNFRAIKKLHDKYGENIYFIKMKMPQEILYQKDTYDTKITLEYINQLTDKSFQCNFENNINFFHSFDGHPNNDGYENLFKCVKRILLDL